MIYSYEHLFIKRLAECIPDIIEVIDKNDLKFAKEVLESWLESANIYLKEKEENATH